MPDPKLSRDMISTPAAISAVANDSPSYALTVAPLTMMLTGAGLMTPSLMRLLIKPTP